MSRILSSSTSPPLSLSLLLPESSTVPEFDATSAIRYRPGKAAALYGHVITVRGRPCARGGGVATAAVATAATRNQFRESVREEKKRGETVGERRGKSSS